MQEEEALEVEYSSNLDAVVKWLNIMQLWVEFCYYYVFLWLMMWNILAV